MKIDVHCHVQTARYLKEIEKLSGGKDAEKILTDIGIPIPTWNSTESRLAKMDELGIDIEVLSTSMPPGSFGDKADLHLAQMTNDFIGDLCSKHPSRFKGFANVPLHNPSLATEELNRAVNDLGLIGIAVGTYIGRLPLTSPKYLSFFEEVNRLKLPIHIHPSIPAESELLAKYHLGAFLGFLFETTVAAARMVFDGIFEKFPDINLILSHFGGTLPFVSERVDDGYKGFREIRGNISKLPSEYFKQFYYDTASSFTKSSFMCTYGFAGPDKVVFGTDDPWARSRLIENKIRKLEELDLPDEEMKKIYSENAKEALRLRT
jgi:aminocarboxymuconate-semialdehyde decarboxylase